MDHLDILHNTTLKHHSKDIMQIGPDDQEESITLDELLRTCTPEGERDILRKFQKSNGEESKYAIHSKRRRIVLHLAFLNVRKEV